MTLRCFSYGGGVQSTAALVLAAQGKIDFPIFLFSNVGDDSEHPDTLRYVEEHAKPYAAANGIELIELRQTGNGSDETLLQYTLRHSERSGAHIIPIFLRSGMPGMRSCTSNFKIRRIASWQKANGATNAEPSITGIGISIDEFQRMKTSSGIKWQTLTYPLIDMRLSRLDCMHIVERAGLPIPGKSSCWFCPFHTVNGWRKMRDKTPELFDAAVVLEETISTNSQRHGHDCVTFHRSQRPLSVICAGHQMDMFDDVDDTCESGFCMT